MLLGRNFVPSPAGIPRLNHCIDIAALGGRDWRTVLEHWRDRKQALKQTLASEKALPCWESDLKSTHSPPMHDSSFSIVVDCSVEKKGPEEERCDGTFDSAMSSGRAIPVCPCDVSSQQLPAESSALIQSLRPRVNLCAR